MVSIGQRPPQMYSAADHVMPWPGMDHSGWQVVLVLQHNSPIHLLGPQDGQDLRVRSFQEVSVQQWAGMDLYG